MNAIMFLITATAVVSCIYLIYKRRRLNEDAKILNLLLRVNEIIISTATNLEQVVQEIGDAIVFELGFKVGVVFLIDTKRQVLKRVAVSRTKLVEAAVTQIGKEFRGLETSLSYTQNLAVQVALDGKMRTTHNLFDVLTPHMSQEEAKIVQQMGQVRTTLIFAITNKARRLGVMIISLDDNEHNLSKAKILLISRLVNFVGIALDSSLIYKNLADTKDQLRKANTQLVELDKIKDDFVSIASHELRTPMTAIKSYLWMATKRPDITLSEKMNKYLSRAYISTERLINLVNDMLNVSRIESGRIEIKPVSFDLLALVDDVIAEVAAKAQEKRIHLSVFKAQVPKPFADLDKVHQILLNLIGNALKFTPEDGEISVSFFSDGKMLDISVKDSGVGISQEDLPRLFKKFERLDNSYVATATSGGTGLGLFISKSLVELMQGRIWAQSEGVGKGTTFIFSLPVATPDVLAQAAKYTKTVEGEVKQLEPVAI